MTYISTKDMSRADWLKARKMGIGGSDSWRIVLDPEEYKYAGCLELFREKTSDEIDESDSLPARIGRELEGFVADLYTEATGIAVHKWNRIIISDAHPFMTANIDRKLLGKNEGLECKTIGEFAARKYVGTDEDGKKVYIDRFIEGDMEASLQNKLEWYIQMQHYMAVTGWDMWHLAVLIGNRQFLWYDVPRDQAWIDHIIAKETEFWDCVVSNNNIWED
jgi:predicted phage-related endonuclease